MTDRKRLRALYVCYLSLDDPLVDTQVVSYLEGLATRGHTIHLLTFEPRRLSPAERSAIRTRLGQRGIHWHRLRYHKRPSLPATVYDAIAGAVWSAALIWRFRLTAFHARSHVPAAMALISRRLTKCELIFDIRGLMAEEYADAGRWRRDGVAFRITKRVERAAIGEAAGVVVLTHRVKLQLFGPNEPEGAFVIPCCADIERIEKATAASKDARSRLGLEGRSVLVYVGKFSGWYMATEMVQFFAAAREVFPTLHFLILTQHDPAEIRREFEAAGLTATDYTITRAEAADVGRYLGLSDFAISFIQPAPSKASSSPTKVGEYLAAGLPIVCSAGVGDLDDIVRDGTGVLVHEHSRSTHLRAAEKMAGLLSDPRSRETCRELARSQLSLRARGIPLYDQLYQYVAEHQH